MPNDTIQRADVVAILRGLALKFQDERDGHRKEERDSIGHDDAFSVAECRGLAVACHNHASIVRKLADEIEQGAK